MKDTGPKMCVCETHESTAVSGSRPTPHTSSMAAAPLLDVAMSAQSPYEDVVSIMLLENIKNKLLHAFRTTATEPRRGSEDGAALAAAGRSFQANEELRRAKIDGAISWLRSELLTMRSQDRQLAHTLLALNTEIQTLRRETGPLLLDPNGSDQA